MSGNGEEVPMPQRGRGDASPSSCDSFEKEGQSVMGELVLDGHTHCGLTIPLDILSREWKRAAIDGGVVFSPVEEIYDRYDSFFEDSEEYKQSRRAVHEYLLRISVQAYLFPYFFVWNDFPSIPDGFVGIKWHRHPGEPVYNYGTRACERIIGQICERRLPIVLEEEFHNTLNFVRDIAGRTVVIIPHMGALNGGYVELKEAGVFENPTVWVDTALAGRREISDFARSFGIDRIIFGSDYPFGIPMNEKRKLHDLFSDDDLSAVLSGNLMKLLKR
jgi:uncharacterized protein